MLLDGTAVVNAPPLTLVFTVKSRPFLAGAVHVNFTVWPACTAVTVGLPIGP